MEDKLKNEITEIKSDIKQIKQEITEIKTFMKEIKELLLEKKNQKGDEKTQEKTEKTEKIENKTNEEPKKEEKQSEEKKEENNVNNEKNTEEKKEEQKTEKVEEKKENTNNEQKPEKKPEDELYEDVEEEPSVGFNKETFISTIDGKIEDKYTKIKELGCGGYARVMLVKSKFTGQEYACKELEKKKMADLAGFKREINIMIKLDHPNIIKLYEIYETTDYIYLIMELCSGGELFDRIITLSEQGHMFSEEEAAITFHQMMSAINYCHKNNIVHRDLKTENLLYLNKEPNSPIKIIDFGMSKVVKPSDIMFEKVGTAYYIAPEVLDGMYDEKCDIWSAGVILYILLCGYPVFNGETDEDIYREIKKGVVEFPEEDWGKISPDVKNLIKKMLSDVSVRPSAEEVLNEPWVKNKAANALRGTIRINGQNLKNYAASNKMRKAVLTYIASRLSIKDIEELTNNFKQIDVNNDGKLTLAEIQTAVGNNKGFIMDNVEQIFKSIDTDNNGSIEYTEFITACLDKNTYLQEEKLKEAFNLFDIDKDGIINSEEIGKILGMDKKSKEINNLVKKYDNDKDGALNFEEFMKMMKDYE